MNEKTLLIGIDCATKANKVGIAVGSLAENGHIIVTDAQRSPMLRGGVPHPAETGRQSSKSGLKKPLMS